MQIQKQIEEAITKHRKILAEATTFDEMAIRTEKLIREALNAIATKSAEVAQTKNIEIRQIIGANAVFLLPSHTEQVEGFWHNKEYRVKGIDVTNDIQEALSKPKE